MKVFQVLKDCHIRVGDNIMEEFIEGKFYISSDDYFNKLSMFIGGAIGIEIPFNEIYNKYEGQDLNGKKLFAIRHGGGGDILFMLTALRELKRKYKNSKISIAVRKQYSGLVLRAEEGEKEKNQPDQEGIDQKNPVITSLIHQRYDSEEREKEKSIFSSLKDLSSSLISEKMNLKELNEEENNLIYKIHSLPILLDEWNQYHYHITFENLIENNSNAKKYNAYDLFMKQVGLDINHVPPENKIPFIKLEDHEQRFKTMEFPCLISEKRKVGIQIKTSSPIRTYPPFNYIKISKELIKKGYEVYFFGGEEENLLIEQLIKEIGIGSYNVIQKSLRGSIVTASMMNFFIAPDSMFIHVAGAFRIPTIGIYGPFHSESRMKYMKNSIGIDVETGCSPCYLHGHQPCPKGEPSPCFSLITPDLILDAFNHLEENKNEIP